jgi:hypothetical protein
MTTSEPRKPDAHPPADMTADDAAAMAAWALAVAREAFECYAYLLAPNPTEVWRCIVCGVRHRHGPAGCWGYGKTHKRNHKCVRVEG